MKSLVLSLSALALTLSAAHADPLADREALMKARGGIVGSLAPIAKGEQPFDAAKVLAALQQLAANATVDVDALWPAGSDGGDTTSSPKIWQDMAGFKAATAKMKADADAAVAANPQDLDAFRAVFGTVTQNCASCHEAFRVKKG